MSENLSSTPSVDIQFEHWFKPDEQGNFPLISHLVQMGINHGLPIRDAQDYAADVMFSTWRRMNAPDQDPVLCPEAYATGAMINRTNDHFRAKNRRDRKTGGCSPYSLDTLEEPEVIGSRSGRNELYPAFEPHSCSFEDQIHSRIYLEEVWNGPNMSDWLKHVVYRHVIEEFSYEEIAKELGLTKGALKAKLHRERAKLRNAMGIDDF